MKRKAVNTGLSIRIITLIILFTTAGFFIAALFRAVFLVPGAILLLISLFCSLFTPVAYEVSGKKLRVFLRCGKREFGTVIRCSLITKRLPFTLRLLGNGGLFAGTGTFWNREYGVFRMYVTSACYSDWVLVETERQKIVISPENPEEFIQQLPF